MATRRCPNCQSQWPSRGSRWCGACGEPLPAPEAGWLQRAGPHWLGWLVAAALVAFTGALIVNVGGTRDLVGTRDDGSSLVDADVELPDEARRLRPERVTCRPEGCALWRASLPEGGEVRASSELVVHVGDARVTALDAVTGRVVWRAATPGQERAGAAMPSVVQLAADRLLLGYSAGDDDDDTSRLLAYDTADGQIVLDVDLDLLRRVFALGWRDGSAIVFGTAATSLLLEGSPRSLLFAVTGDGEIPWTRDGVFVPELDLEREPLLVRSETTLMRLDPQDGRALWEHPAVTDAAGRHGEWLVVHPDRDRVTRLAVDSGEVLGGLDVVGVASAVAIGPWIGAAVDGDLHVFRDDLGAGGDVLFVREDAEPLVSSLEVDDLVVVAWGHEGRSDVEVVVYRRHDGSVIGALTIDAPAGPQPLTLTMVEDDPAARAQQGSLVELRVDHGATIAVVEVASGALVRQFGFVPDEFVAAAARLVSRDGVTEVQGGDGAGVSVFGPDGLIEVVGADALEPTGPLLARSSTSVLRLDRRTLDASVGEDDLSSAGDHGLASRSGVPRRVR